MPTSENAVIGGEGDVTVEGVAWCQVSVTITVEKTQQSITSACDFDATDRATYGRDKTTGKRYIVSLEFDLDKTKDPWPTFDSSDDDLAVTVVLYSGYQLVGTFTCRSMTFTSNGIEGVYRVSVELASQGKPTQKGEAA